MKRLKVQERYPYYGTSKVVDYINSDLEGMKTPRISWNRLKQYFTQCNGQNKQTKYLKYYE